MSDVMSEMKPVFVTFVDLSRALTPLHQGNTALIAELHDIWKAGAPSPDSLIRNLKNYDERLQQAGNMEKRLLLPTAYIGWVMRVSAERGMPISAAQAAALMGGKVQFTA